MRRLPKILLTGAWALAALLALPHPGSAEQRTMRFRPVPPESAARYDSRDRAAAAREDSLDRADSGNSDALEVPAVPVVPSVRATSGDIVRFGSDVTITHEQVVEGDVVSFGGDVEVRGHVTGNVSAMGGDLTLAPTARVDGDVVCIGGTLREEDGSSVGGQRVTAPRTPGAKLFMPIIAVVGTGFKIITHLLGMLFGLGLAWLFVKLAPQRTRSALDQVLQEPGPALLTGLTMLGLIIPSVIALALVIALLCITIIGIPIAAAVAVAYGAFFFLSALWGSVVGAGVLGSRLYPRFKGGEGTLMQSVLWGVVALHGMRIASDLLHIVPMFGFLGGLLTFMHFVALSILGILGAGALVRGEYQRRSLQNWWQRMRPPSGGPRNDMPPPPGSSYGAPPPAGSGASGAEVIS